jgi:hypothetical protein
MDMWHAPYRIVQFALVDCSLEDQPRPYSRGAAGGIDYSFGRFAELKYLHTKMVCN